MPQTQLKPETIDLMLKLRKEGRVIKEYSCEICGALIGHSRSTGVERFEIKDGYLVLHIICFECMEKEGYKYD